MAHEIDELSHALWEVCPLGSITFHCSDFRTFPLRLHEVTEAWEEGRLQGGLERGPRVKRHSVWLRPYPHLTGEQAETSRASHIAFLASVFIL